MFEKLLGAFDVKKLIYNVGGSVITALGAYLSASAASGVPVTKSGAIAIAGVAVGANVIGLFQKTPAPRTPDQMNERANDPIAAAIERAQDETRASLAAAATTSTAAIGAQPLGPPPPGVQASMSVNKPMPSTPGTFGRRSGE